MESGEQESGITLLMRAAADDGDIGAVKALIVAGADVNATCRKNGWSALMYVSRMPGRCDVAKLLIDYGAEVNFLDSRGSTPLSLAISHRQTDVVKVLLGAGADVNLGYTRGGVTPVFDVALNRGDDYALLVIEHGLDVNGVNNRGDGAIRTPLIEAAISGSLACVQALLDRGADPDAVDENGCTPLMNNCASSSSAVGVLVSLLSGGANLNAKDTWGRNVLHHAVFSGAPDIVPVLAARGADLECMCREGDSDDDEMTPLMKAAKCVRPRAAEGLINAGASVNARNQKGLTPLMLAAAASAVWHLEAEQVMRLCLQAGAAVDATDDNGMTALMHAASKGGGHGVQCLLSSGADYGVSDKKGLTCLAHAQRNGHKAVVGLLSGYSQRSGFNR